MSRVPSRLRGVLLLLGVAAAGSSVLLEPTATVYPGIAVLEVLVIVGFAVAGYLLSEDPQQRGNGRLLLATALLQVLTHLHLIDDSPFPMIAWLTGPLSAVPGAVVLLRFPGARLDRWSRAWAVSSVGAIVALRLLFLVPPPERRLGWWPAIPFGSKSASVLSTASSVVLAGLTLSFALLLIRRIRSLRGVARHELMPVVIAAVSASVTVVLHLLSVADSRSGVNEIILGLEQLGLLSVPAAFIFSAVVMRIARAAVGDLLLAVNHATSAAQLQAALAQTLFDPDLTLLRWVSAEKSWYDVEGAQAHPNQDPDKLVVPVEGRDGPLAAIVTEPSIGRQRHLLDSTVAATRLTLETSAAVSEVRESRARIVSAGLVERRRLERNLHDGVQQRMLVVKMQLEHIRLSADSDALRQRASSAVAELSATIEEIRDLARGVHPAVLTHSGLAAAVESTAGRSPLNVDVSIPGRRWPDTVEGTAYFFISEALSNVVKHARCQSANVTVVDDGVRLIVSVTDEGCGGADPLRGSGLVGLSDRVAATGGTVTMTSEEGRGTCLRASIPYESR